MLRRDHDVETGEYFEYEDNSKKKVELVNFTGNLGKELIKKIYATAYRLEATQVIVNKSRYNKFALCELNCEDGCISLEYSISI